MRISFGRTVGWILAVSCAACGGTSTDGRTFTGDSCIPGFQARCACKSGSTGTQVCSERGAYDACDCADDDDDIPLPTGGAGRSSSNGGASQSSGGSKNSGGSGNSSGAGGASTDLPAISTGTTELVDAFVAATGVYVVLGNSLTLFDRNGEVVRRVDMPREVTAAAFDGEHLAIADQGKLTSYDLELNQIASTTTLETCVSLVVLSKQRAVCGPENDWDRVFYTYDLSNGALLASSSKYTYNGIPMRRVPGTDDFVTVTVDTSPSDFHLYRLADTDVVEFVNESPYHGDFRVTNTYGFDGAPATQLITDAGLLLKIYGDGCDTMTNSFTSGCFTKDGSIGTLSGAQLFVGLDTDTDGQVFALVDANPNSFSDDDEFKNYLLERIDLATRTVTKQSTISLQLGKLIAFRRDVSNGSLLIAYRKGSRSYFPSSGQYPGYEVRSISF